MTTDVVRDERTVFIENTSYKWGLAFLQFGILLDVFYRGLVRTEALPPWLSHDFGNWDLMALVVLSSVVMGVYQGVRGILWEQISSRQFLAKAGALMCVVLVAQAVAAWMVIHWVTSAD